jgi:hypothetical protein
MDFDKELKNTREAISNLELKLDIKRAYLVQLENFMVEEKKLKKIQEELREQQEVADALRSVIQQKKIEFDQLDIDLAFEDDNNDSDNNSNN